MSGILVDSNILLDILPGDSAWKQWSADAISTLGEQAILIINPIIYAEVSVRFDSIEELDDALPISLVRREALPYDASFLAGKCFIQYKERGGAKKSVMPDFYIGAHAATRGYRLLTRDPRRYRTYFPTLELVSPSG